MEKGLIAIAAALCAMGGCVTGIGEAKVAYHAVDAIERLVEELANTKDKVIIELLNAFPVMPVYGIEPPFGNRTVNAIIGYLLPVDCSLWGGGLFMFFLDEYPNPFKTLRRLRLRFVRGIIIFTLRKKRVMRKKSMN